MSTVEYRREYRARNKDKIKNYLDKYRKDPENNKKHLQYMKDYNKSHKVDAALLWAKKNPNKFQFNQVKARAKRNNVPFSLDYNDIVWPTHCPVLGIELNRIERDHCPSFDRVDPSKGYIKGNVFIISNRANRMKQEATLENLEALVCYVKSKLSSVVVAVH